MSGDERTTKHLALKIINVIVFLFFFSSSLYSAIGHQGYYGHKETYLTPAGYAFWIWTIIDLLLLGLVIFQWFPAGGPVGDVIGWRFPIVAILNGIFVHLYVGSHYIAAFIFALLTALVISHIFYDLKTKASPSSTSHPLANLIFVHLPFSLWHAWSIITLIISLFSAFGVDKSTHKAGVGTVVCGVIALAWLAATSIGYALHSEQGDLAGAIVIFWYLVGVFAHQHQPVIHWVSFAAWIIALLAIVKVLFFSFRSKSFAGVSSADERAPLIA